MAKQVFSCSVSGLIQRASDLSLFSSFKVGPLIWRSLISNMLMIFLFWLRC